MKPTALVTSKIRLRNSSSGRIGSAARRSTKGKSDEKHDAARDHRDALRRAPRIRRPAEAREQHDPRQRPGEHGRAEVVDPVRDPLRAAVEDGADDNERGDADRQVDVEDPAPRKALGEEAADQRPDDGRDREHAAEVALIAAALARRDDVADDGDRGHDQPAGAEPLQRPERDQLGHAPADPAQRGAGEEEHDRELEDDLPAVQVAELPVQRPDHRRGEQVRRDHPGQVLDPAEVADDRRQRRRDDRLVERRDEQHEQQRPEDQAHPLRPLDGSFRRRRHRPANVAGCITRKLPGSSGPA